MALNFDNRVDVKNKHNQIAVVFGDDSGDGKDRDHVGGTRAVGDGEFRSLVGGVMNYHEKRGVNDAQNILEELLFGDGISGVELIGLDGDSFTISASNGRATDFMIFEGDAAAAAIANLQTERLDAGDNRSQFHVFDASNPDERLSILGGGDYGDGVHFPNTLRNGNFDFDAFLTQLLTNGGYDSATVIDVDGSSIALSLARGGRKADTLVITGLEDALGALATANRDDLFKGDDIAFGIVSADTSFSFNSSKGDLLSDIVGNLLNGSGQRNFNEANQLLDALIEAGGELSDDDETITLVGVDSDSLTIEYTFGGDTTVVVYDFG
ncbi:MAG: hypothetical protein AAGH53_13790 [Pseudomonadota bacterium]